MFFFPGRSNIPLIIGEKGMHLSVRTCLYYINIYLIGYLPIYIFAKLLKDISTISFSGTKLWKIFKLFMLWRISFMVQYNSHFKPWHRITFLELLIIKKHKTISSVIFTANKVTRTTFWIFELATLRIPNVTSHLTWQRGYVQ